jgi:hypothetical protein
VRKGCWQMSSMEKTGARKRFLFFAQLAFILAPVTLFFDAALVFRGRINLSVFTAATVFVILNIGLLLLITFSVRYFLMYLKNQKLCMSGDQRTDVRTSKKKMILSCLPVTFVAGVFSVLAALQFSSLPRYDGGLYYDALITATEKFTFNPDSLVSSFTFFTHPMQGTSLLIGIGEMLFPRQVAGVYGVTLLLTIISIFCLYNIFGRIFPDKPAWLKAAGTAVFAFCPYLLGLFSHISPDYFSLMFFVILLYAFSEELDYLAAFVSLLLVFSKETGILFAASFLIPAILFRAGKAEGGKYIEKLKRYLFPRRFLLYGLAPVLFLYKVIVLKGLTYAQSNTDASPLRWDNNSLFCFGFNLGYISARMAQFVFNNFLWVITLLAAAAVLLFLFRRFKGEDLHLTGVSGDIAIVAGITVSTIVFVIFSCLYITTMCPRYNVFFALPASLICVWAVSNIWKNQTIVKIAIGGVIVLFLLQNYFNLDPSLSLGNQKIDMGYEYIYSPTEDYSFMDLSNIGEMYVYNHTYTYYDDLLEQAMAKIKPDANSHFLTIDTDWYETYLIGDPNQTKHFIYWDPVNLKRTYDNKRDGVFLPKLLSFTGSDIISAKSLDLPADFYLILTAREDVNKYCGALESRGYDIKDSFVAENYLGYLTVFHFVRGT